MGNAGCGSYRAFMGGLTWMKALRGSLDVGGPLHLETAGQAVVAGP